MFIGSFKKSFALKNDYLKHLRDRLLVNVDHKYPLYCNQPKCNFKKEMDFCFTKKIAKSYLVSFLL